MGFGRQFESFALVLKIFLGGWLAYWLVVALLPVHSMYPSTAAAFLLQLTFVGLVAFSYIAIGNSTYVGGLPKSGACDLPSARILIRIAIAMSVVGLVALAYDKIYVQGIDYTAGLAEARQQWVGVGQEREGQASSIFSVLGYLLSSGYFVATVLAITQTRVVSSRERLITILASLLLVLANSVLTGGRSSVLLFVVFAVCSLATRSGLRIRLLIVSPGQRRLILVLACIAAAYTVYIFYARAESNGASALEYAIDFLPYLGLQADDWYRQALDGSFLSSLSAMCVLSLGYITHSFASVAAIVDAATEDKRIVFVSAYDILYKLGFSAKPDGDWFLSGRAPSLPGALWHEYGLTGFVSASLALGALCGGCKVWTVKHATTLLPLGAFVMAGATMVLTPAVFAGDFLSFPFVMGSFVILSIIEPFLPKGRHVSEPLKAARPPDS
jgi:hypothetical protein